MDNDSHAPAWEHRKNDVTQCYKDYVADSSNGFPHVRMRRLRSSPQIRGLLQETTVSLNDLIYPIFVEEEDEWAPTKKPYDLSEEGAGVVADPASAQEEKTEADKPLVITKYYDDRAKKEAESDEVLARVHEALSARVPLTTFEEHVERWREIASDHGFAGGKYGGAAGEKLKRGQRGDH